MDAHRRHERILIAIIVAVFAIAIAGVQVIANNANARDADNAVASCERGNEIRDYLAFDNRQRIIRLEQQITFSAGVPEADLRAFGRELDRRYSQRERLVPFDCNTLR